MYMRALPEGMTWSLALSLNVLISGVFIWDIWRNMWWQLVWRSYDAPWCPCACEIFAEWWILSLEMPFFLQLFNSTKMTKWYHLDGCWLDGDRTGDCIHCQHPLSKPRSRARQVWFAQALPAGSGTLCSTAAEHKIIGFWKSKKNIEKPCFV